MGTLMEDKIKQAFDEWKKVDQELQQPNGESNVGKDTKETKNRTLAQQLLERINNRPGITGKELRAIISTISPGTPASYVPAVLKGLYDGHYVSRKEVPNLDGHHGRSTFAYYAMSEAEREAARKRPKVKTQPKYTKKKAVAVEVVDRADRTSRGIATLMPAKRHAMHALEVGPATVSISIAMQNGSTYSMNVNDARFVYAQLNQIFGGAR